jgi:hypothetical protein
VKILRIGAAAEAFKADQGAFDALLAKATRYQAEKEPGPRAHFDDPDKLLPTDPPRAVNFNYKLANFERATGLRIYARVFAKFAPGSTGDTPQAFTDQLSRSLKIGDRGVLAVYFSDSGKWSLSIGKALVGKFSKSSTGTQKSAENATFEPILDMFFTKAREREAKYTDQTKATLPNFLQIQGQKLKIHVDSILDELLIETSS